MSTERAGRDFLIIGVPKVGPNGLSGFAESQRYLRPPRELT
jgi:hypothetical protein